MRRKDKARVSFIPRNCSLFLKQQGARGLHTAPSIQTSRLYPLNVFYKKKKKHTEILGVWKIVQIQA